MTRGRIKNLQPLSASRHHIIRKLYNTYEGCMYHGLKVLRDTRQNCKILSPKSMPRGSNKKSNAALRIHTS